MKAMVWVEVVVIREKLLVLDGLSLDESIVPGQLRNYSVGVGGYRAAPAKDCE